MAKSLRSKTKRTFRRTKRTSGVYAVADAARLQRLSSKLRQKVEADEDGDIAIKEVQEIVQEIEKSGNSGEASVEDMVNLNEENKPLNSDTLQTPKVSTSGPRLSRRDSWRLSKGLQPHRKNPDKVNRLGVVVAKRRAGRTKRRR